MRRTARIAIASLVLWLLTGCIAWWVLTPGAQLIGLRQVSHASSDLLTMNLPNTQAALATLREISIWGVQRNGQIAQAKAAPVVEEPIEWRVLGTIERAQDRALLIQEAGSAARQVNEGEALPDQSILRNVRSNQYTIELLNGEQQTLTTLF